MAKILLCEDDVVLSDMYVKKFQLAGLDVTAAIDGEQGLAEMRKSKPDIVLLDIMMPKKNGLDTLKEIKEDPDLKDCYVVLLSNVGEQSYIDEGFSLGANQYLMKSNFTPGEVLEKVKGWLAEIGKA